MEGAIADPRLQGQWLTLWTLFAIVAMNIVVAVDLVAPKLL
jgi:hypothetical protein